MTFLEFVPTTTAPSFAQPVKFTFTIPPPAYPGTQFTPIHPSKKVAPVQFVAQPKVTEPIPNCLDKVEFLQRLQSGINEERQPIIRANNYLDVRASNTLSKPQKEKEKIQDEQYLLGIPPPPQYPGHATFGPTYKNQVWFHYDLSLSSFFLAVGIDQVTYSNRKFCRSVCRSRFCYFRHFQVS